MKKLFTLLCLAVSLSAFSVSVTFNVDMTGQTLVKDTVWIVGDVTANESGDWLFEPMISLGNNIYTWSTTAEAGDTMAYYYITVNSWDSAGNQDWSYYTRYREYLDTNVCKDYLMWGTDRTLIVPATDVVIDDVWATCPSTTGIVNNSQITTEIFPNPTSGILNFNLSSFNNNIEIEIIDITGKVRQSFNNLSNTVQSIRIDVQHGIYFVKISDGINVLNKKIMVN